MMLDTGPLRGRFRIERRVQLEPDVPETVIVQDIELARDSALVTFKMHGTWHARQTMLKVSFDLPFEAQLVAVDVPYGIAERPPNTASSAGFLDADTLAEDGQIDPATAPEPDRYMQKWLDTSDGQRGMLFLNNGRYGYDAEPGKVGLSLLRSPFMRPERGEIIGLGPFSLTYAVMPHRGNWREVDAPRLGYSFNITPAVVYVQPGRNEGVGCGWWDVLELAPAGVLKDFFTITGEGVIGTVLKQAHDGDGLVLRFFESLGQRVEARITFCHAVLSAVECDLLERNVGEGPCSVQGHMPPKLSGAQVAVVLNPFEIKTLRVKLRVSDNASRP